MKTNSAISLIIVVCIMLAASLACSGSQDPNVAIAIALTQTAAAAGQPANTPTLIPPTLIPPTQPPPFTATPGPTNTPGSTGCTNNVRFIADVTIPDKTVVTPGGTFTKVWRVKNSGTCTWTSSYRLAFAGGNQMSGPGTVSISGNVAPGAEYDVSVNQTAPTAPGEYQGRWQFVDNTGAVFGQVYVLIIVPGTPTPTSTPSATPKAGIDFWADRTTIYTGQCVTISWQVANVNAVFFEGEGVPGTGRDKVCPSQTKVYDLRVEKRDGSVETRQLKIQVLTGTPPPPVRQQGSVTLSTAPNNPKPEAYLNLDNGVRGDAMGGDYSGADVKFIISGTQLVYIFAPVNGAVAKLMGAAEPGYTGCKQAAGSLSAGSISSMAASNYICVKTNKDRYSQVRIEAIEAIASGIGSIRLGFITWEEE